MWNRNETRDDARRVNRSASSVSDCDRPRDSETGHLKLLVCDMHTSVHKSTAPDALADRLAAMVRFLVASDRPLNKSEGRR